MSESGAGAAVGASPGGEGATAQTTQGEAAGGQSQQKATTPEGSTEDNTTGEKVTTEKQHEGEEKPRHKYHDRLTKHYPDRKFEADEDYDSALEEYLTEHETYRERGDKSNAKLISLMEAEPKVAAVLRDSIENGVPFNVALAKHYGPEDFELSEGDEHYADYEANVKSRNEAVAKKRAKDAEFSKNVEESNKAVSEWAEENNLKPEQVKQVLDDVDQMVSDMLSGKVTKDTLTKLMKAVTFEAAVKEAAETAEIKGKNAAIKAEMSKEEPKGDGIPDVSKGGELKQTKKPASWIDDIVDTANKKRVFK